MEVVWPVRPALPELQEFKQSPSNRASAFWAAFELSERSDEQLNSASMSEPVSGDSAAKLAEQPPEEQSERKAEDGHERTDESANAQFTSEDEAWRSYLENPSMGLSIAANDEDTAGALGNFV